MRGRACRSVAATAAAGVIIATVLLVMSGSTLPLTTPPAPVVHDSTGGHFTRPVLLPDDHTRTSAPPPNRDGPVPERANVAGWSGDGSVAQEHAEPAPAKATRVRRDSDGWKASPGAASGDDALPQIMLRAPSPDSRLHSAQRMGRYVGGMTGVSHGTSSPGATRTLNAQLSAAVTSEFWIEALAKSKLAGVRMDRTSLKKLAFELVYRVSVVQGGPPVDEIRSDGRVAAAGSMDQGGQLPVLSMHTYFKVGGSKHEYGFQESVRFVSAMPRNNASRTSHISSSCCCSHAIDRVFGFHMVPPTLMARVDLHELSRVLAMTNTTAAKHIGAGVSSLLQSLPRHYRGKWKSNGPVRCVACLSACLPDVISPGCVYKHCVQKEAIGSLVLFYGSSVDSMPPTWSLDERLYKTSPSEALVGAAAEYTMLMYLLHCQKKSHNIFFDEQHTDFVVSVSPHTIPLILVHHHGFCCPCRRSTMIGVPRSLTSQAQCACAAASSLHIWVPTWRSWRKDLHRATPSSSTCDATTP